MEKRTHTWDKAARGIFFFILGLAKKVLIADSVAGVAGHIFNGNGGGGLLPAWLGVTAYTLQIYFDFSGYSDMAVGLGMMFGFEFPQNFNSPYKAISITDFWRRWHISLSSWLRDYLYIPLGGSRRGELRTYANLFTVMLLGGLWHGCQLDFFVMGGVPWCVVGDGTALRKTKCTCHRSASYSANRGSIDCDVWMGLVSL